MAGDRISLDAPLKMMIRDIKKAVVNTSETYPWRIQFSYDNKDCRSVPIEFKEIWLQGVVKRLEKGAENILINDGSGEVRITNCSRAPGDRTWITPGVYCGVLASVSQPSKNPPEVVAVKLMHISQQRYEAESMWPLEVEELSKFLTGKVTFKMK